MKVLLRIEVEIIVLFAFVKEFLLHPVLPTGEVLLDFELLSPQVVHELDVPLKEILGHAIVIL